VERTPILYDDDCGFCKVALALILLWDRRRRLRPVPIESDEGDRLLVGMDRERRLASWHLVVEGAAPASAGSALPSLLRLLPGGAPLAWASERLPGVTERGYAAVASRRGALGHRIPAGLRRRAGKLVAARSD
jgi:predicted DCC family thiol-disulfide oxidoreductase YuxK